jgi:thiamine-monophosphate kinase
VSKAERSGEFGLIARCFAPLAAGEPGALGLTDDAAVLALPPGQRLVVTTDTLVAGVHFRPDDPPDLIAHKLLGVNLSDLAAMGATPWAYTLNTAYPASIDDAWVERFAATLGEVQKRFAITLVGGDTVSTPGPLVLTLTALGRVEEGRELRRSTAQAGDTIYVSGTIGDAALGLLALSGPLKGLTHEDAAQLIDRYHIPRPRLALGQRLAGQAHAAMDVSDGLIADLAHICETSRLGAIVEAAKVPLSPAASKAIAAAPGLLQVVLGGGDDYELLFTGPAGLDGLLSSSDLPVTPVGRMVAGSGISVLDGKGREISLERRGYTHF